MENLQLIFPIDVLVDILPSSKNHKEKPVHIPRNIFPMLDKCVLSPHPRKRQKECEGGKLHGSL